MSSELLDDGRIGPELQLDDIPLPPHVGERLAAFYGTPGRIETAAEWAATVDDAIRAETGRRPSEADMCTTEDGRHTVDLADESQLYVCALDPLIVPFLRGEPGTVQSVTPEDETTVTFEVGADGVTVDPPTAVVSFGIGHDAPAGDPTLERAYGHLCAYAHTFASAEEYERWAATVDAATTSFPTETGVALARELVDGLVD